MREHRESEWEERDEEDEEEEEEEYRAPARDRLQHAGFDRMAPPGAGNTKPCDYPKHTGSDWVSEPALFPTRLLRTVCGFSAECTVDLFPLKPEENPLVYTLSP